MKKKNPVTEFFKYMKSQQVQPPPGKSYLRGRLVPAGKPGDLYNAAQKKAPNLPQFIDNVRKTVGDKKFPAVADELKRKPARTKGLESIRGMVGDKKFPGIADQLLAAKRQPRTLKKKNAKKKRKIRLESFSDANLKKAGGEALSGYNVMGQRGINRVVGGIAKGGDAVNKRLFAAVGKRYKRKGMKCKMKHKHSKGCK